MVHNALGIFVQVFIACLDVDRSSSLKIEGVVVFCARNFDNSASLIRVTACVIGYSVCFLNAYAVTQNM